MSKRKRRRNPNSPADSSKGSADWVQPIAGLQMAMMTLLLLLAMFIAVYLGWVHVRQGSVAGCGPTSGCHEVLSSQWSTWMGLPVGFLAAPVYLGLLVSLVCLNQPGDLRRYCHWAIPSLILSLMVVAAAAWFFILQWLVLKKFCPWCLTAHAAGLTAAGLVIKSIVFDDKRPSFDAWLTPGRKQVIAAVFLVSTVLLIGGQVLQTPKTFETVEIRRADPESVSESKPDAISTNSQKAVLQAGRHSLDPKEYPVLGKTDAPHLVLSLFDYTCHHCRETHEQIEALHKAFPDDLAILSLPTPLNTDCNPLMQRLGRPTPPAHKDACLLAAMSLAVYRIRPDLWAAYDHWLFTGKEAPPLAVAQAKAVELVGGQPALNQAMRDTWIRDTVHLAVDIFEANMRAQGEGKMPQIMIGKTLTSGSVNSVGELYKLVEQEFGLNSTAH